MYVCRLGVVLTITTAAVVCPHTTFVTNPTWRGEDQNQRASRPLYSTSRLIAVGVAAKMTYV